MDAPNDSADVTLNWHRSPVVRGAATLLGVRNAVYGMQLPPKAIGLLALSWLGILLVAFGAVIIAFSASRGGT